MFSSGLLFGRLYSCSQEIKSIFKSNGLRLLTYPQYCKINHFCAIYFNVIIQILSGKVVCETPKQPKDILNTSKRISTQSKDQTMKKITKPKVAPDTLSSQSSSGQSQATKKQASLGQFFTGVKQPKATKEPIVCTGEINKDIGDGVWKDRSTLKLACWNVNGLRAVLKREDLQNYIKKEDPDILCLNETKIDEATFHKENIQESIPKGYYLYWNFCIPPIKGYSGVSVFSKEKAMSVKRGIDLPNHENEGRVLTVEYENFFVVVVYVPNSGMDLTRLDYRVKSFDKDFHEYLNELKKKKNVVLCGDMNVAHQEIDLTYPSANQNSPGFTIEERRAFSVLLKSGWIDTFRHLYPQRIKYSWWSVRSQARQKDIGWRIDYVIVNSDFKHCIKDSLINNGTFGSDHCPVEFIMDLNAINAKQQQVGKEIASEENEEQTKILDS